MYQFESRVRYSETDSRGKLTPEGIMEYFEDCTTFQSEDIGIGVQYLKESHRVWVLSFVQIGINRYPSLGERIVIRTIPYDIKGFLGYRNFVLLTPEEEVLAYANTMWTYLDTETGRPVKAPDSMIDAYGLSERYPMEYAPRKIAMPENRIAFDDIVVKPHHLDTNDHVNNVEYVRMARELTQDERLRGGCADGGGNAVRREAGGMCSSGTSGAGGEAVPQKVDGGRIVRGLRVEYKQSALLGDVIHPVGAGDAETGRVVFSLNNDEGKPYAVVELTYENGADGNEGL
ncbi:MAG: thioesterase [bacterium]|nr:thioesterase [bacterium]